MAAVNIPPSQIQEQDHLAGHQENVFNITENSKNVLLNKGLYGAKKVIEDLDIDFKEFLLNDMSISKFFELYEKYFYDLSKDTHTTLMTTSINYAYPRGYRNSRLIEHDELRDQLFALQRQIDEYEREHFYIKNRKFITSGTQDDFNSSKTVYFVQSGKKRKILDFNIYLNLKSRYKGGETEDKNYLVFLDQNGIDKMSSGPDIDSIESADITNFAVNIWPILPEEYSPDPSMILSTFENDDGSLVSREAGSINSYGDID